MLTPEQIKSLKKGDPIVINGTVNKINEDGHILATCGGSAVWIDNSYYVSLPSDSQSTATAQLLRSRDGSTVNSQPKYDPTRPFKKGDKVRYEPKLGRYEPHITNGSICTVLSDERNGRVQIEYCDDESVYSATIPFFFLELVTPVEEREPFYLDEITDEDEDEEQYHCFMIKTRKGEDRIRTYYSNKFETIAQTKAAAEAECKRLNEEYRKEQNND